MAIIRCLITAKDADQKLGCIEYTERSRAKVEKFQKILRPDIVSMPLTRIET